MLYHLIRSLPACTALAACILPLPALASDDPPGQGDAPASPAKDSSDDHLHDTIVVTAHGIGRIDFLAGTSTISGTDLQRNMAGQIGEVLEGMPGVSASGFAPGVSRPVLRGFSGDRVRVLIDGIGAIDASSASADHAVSLDPLTAERIDVLRGAATLLYGSSAIGGAVNVIDKRIPRRVPQEAFHFDGLMAVDSAANAMELGGSLDAPLGGGLVAHVDGSHRETDDLHVPGYVLSRDLRAQTLEEADAIAGTDPERAAELRGNANARDVLTNSATRTTSVAAGLAWIGDRANIGASVSRYDTLYGVPGRPDGEQGVKIDLKKKRADLRAGYQFSGGPFAEIDTRWGYSDYQHVELEDGSIPATMFLVDGVEGRVELVQREHAGWTGTIGGQFYHRDLEAIGEEAFVPANKTDQWAIFTLQELPLGPLNVELAGRYERTDVRAANEDPDRRFNAFSGAAGLWWESDGGLRLGINANRAARAPVAEELFADGPHAATQQYEIGDPGLKLETAWGTEAYLRGQIGTASVSLTGFASWFDDYVYLAAAGETLDDLPVYRQLQGSARYYGAEAQASVPLATLGRFTVSTDLSGSYVRATLGDGSPVPRIPPLNLKGDLIAASERVQARVGLDWSAAQNRVLAPETPTDAFVMVNASLAWKPLHGNENVTVIASADNLFDAAGRRATSFTRDYVPMAGRNLKLSLRVSL